MVPDIFQKLLSMTPLGQQPASQPAQAAPVDITPEGQMMQMISQMYPQSDPAADKRQSLGTALGEFGRKITEPGETNFFRAFSRALPAATLAYSGAQDQAKETQRKNAKDMLATYLQYGKADAGNDVANRRLDLMEEGNKQKGEIADQRLKFLQDQLDEKNRHNLVTEGQGGQKIDQYGRRIDQYGQVIDETNRHNLTSEDLQRQILELRKTQEANDVKKAESDAAEKVKQWRAEQATKAAETEGKADRAEVDDVQWFEGFKQKAADDAGLNNPDFQYQSPEEQDRRRKLFQASVDSATKSLNAIKRRAKPRTPSDNAIARPDPVPQSRAQNGSGRTRADPFIPSSQADYDALPSGSYYRKPDGLIYRKK